MNQLWQPGEASQYDRSAFFGREEELAWAAEQLAQGQQRLAIYGMPHIGKTWLLHALADRLGSAYLPIYLDVQELAGDGGAPPLLRTAAALAQALTDQAEVAIGPATSAHLLADPVGAWQAYVEDLGAQAGGRRPVLLLDNAGAAPAAWMAVLSPTPLPMILAAQSRERLPEQLPETARTFPSITLGTLAHEPATDLVKALIAPRVPIDPWAVRRVLEITSAHPHYVQLFCQATVASSPQAALITPTQVESALQQVLDMPVAEFVAMWEGSTPREQVILAVFSSLRGLGGVATQYDVQKACIRHEQALSLHEIVGTLERLVDRGILEKIGTNTYRFRVELYRLWLDHRYRPEEVFRARRWQMRDAFLNGLLNRVQRALAKRRTLWLSLSAVALVLLMVGLQPVLWRRRAEVTPTARPATPTQVAQTATVPPATAIVQAPDPLPGMDLLIMSRTGGDVSWQIYAVDSRTGDRVRLTETTANERTPKWSPDGQRVVFSSDRDGNREIYVMDLEAWRDQGTAYTPLNLTQNDAPDWQPAWSPDGRRIAFSSYRDDNWEIYVINADGTNPVRVTEQIESDISPTWSPDGSKLLFVSRRRGNADLFTYEWASRELTRLTSDPLDEYDPAWSPDGRWIAYVTRFEPQSDIFLMRADGSGAVNLTDTLYVNELQPCWTADAQRLIFTAYISAKGNYDLYVMRRDGSEVSLLLDPESDDVAPSLREITSLAMP